MYLMGRIVNVRVSAAMQLRVPDCADSFIFCGALLVLGGWVGSLLLY